MSPKAHLSSCLLLAASVLAPTAARAANSGVGHGTMMVSAERLFGLSSTRVTQDTGGGEVSLDQTQFGLALAPFSQAPQIYTIPRLAFDFAIIDGLTVGGSLGFVLGDTGSSATVGGTTTDADGPSFTTFLIAPRIGYVLGLGRTLNLWLRGGFTYFNTAVHTDASALPPNSTRTQTLWGMSLNLEPTLMIAPFEHVAFTVGVLVDLPVAGKQSTERTNGSVTTTTSVDTSVRNLGLVAGLVVMF
ncbi:MAG TPA: hypothetical protein VN914_04795 [Polyangia bacterium]|nr:hypothetical protein [Polyangia bacterium]